jgi:outer membrane protein OmpA-like peptidoglycan-associated protein
MMSSRQNPIESDLTARATDGLKAASLTDVQVNVDHRGRDVQLTGKVASDAERDQAVKLVQAIHGVRVVDNAIEVVAPVAAATSTTTVAAPAPAPEAIAPAAPPAEPAAPATTAEVAAPAPAPAPTAEPSFALMQQDGKWVLQGTLNSQEEINQAVSNAEQVYGAGNVLNQLTVGAVAPAAWLASLAGLKDALTGLEQAGLKYANGAFVLMGTASSEELKTATFTKVQQLLGGMTIDNQLTVKAAEPAPVAAAEPATAPAAPATTEEPAPATTSTASTEPAPVPLTAEQQSCQDKINSIMTGKEILFETNKAAIKSGSFSLLNNIAQIGIECKAVLADKTIRIGGHTDNVGADDYNQKLSQERADAVKDYLGKQGLDTGSLQSVGYGELQPIASNDTEAGRAQNRRISFDIIQK